MRPDIILLLIFMAIIIVVVLLSVIYSRVQSNRLRKHEEWLATPDGQVYLSAVNDYDNWLKQEDRSVPTPWKRQMIRDGVANRTPGFAQRYDFVLSELVNPEDKLPLEQEYLIAELVYMKRVMQDASETKVPEASPTA